MKLRKNYKNNFITDKNEDIINYNFNKGSNRGNMAISNRTRNAIRIINNFFSSVKVLFGKPQIRVTSDEVIIKVFYYVGKQEAFNNDTINNLGVLLEKFYDRPVKLKIVKLDYPHLDRTILAKYLRLNVKKYNFQSTKDLLYKKRGIVKNARSLINSNLNLPSYIVGIKLKISGRLITERARPRQTVSTRQIGIVSTNHKTSLIDYGTYVRKNKHGAFTVKV